MPIKDISFWNNYQGGHRMQSGWMPAMKLFLEKNHSLPCILQFTSEHSSFFHYKSVETVINEHIGEYIPEQDVFVQYFDTTQNRMYFNERYCDLGNGLAILMLDGYLKNELESAENIQPDTENGYYACMEDIYILHVPSQKETAAALLQKLRHTLLTVKVASTLNMVCKESYDYYLYPFEIKKPHLNLDLNYGS
ncbi:MAG: hypothetical protein K1X92_18440, partial [Bacteroidia bacterium]|nr:hypothetical protein [Bacteroidia bacterium]